MPFVDYYEALFIRHSAAPDQIKARYKELAKKYHPDRNKSANSLRRMQIINEAYEVLSNPEAKRNYDKIRLEYYYEATQKPPVQSKQPEPDYWRVNTWRIWISKSIWKNLSLYIWGGGILSIIIFSLLPIEWSGAGFLFLFIYMIWGFIYAHSRAIESRFDGRIAYLIGCIGFMCPYLLIVIILKRHIHTK